MKKHQPLLTMVAAIIVLFVLKGFGKPMDSKIDIPYQKFILKNGLTVLVHEDHKAPIVAVNVWYHVGSKNEKPGRTGFAHLFEHLMFNGSEHVDQDYFQVMEKIGATDLNGTTSEDRTNYFQNVPTPSLDLALFMESDRMGHLLGAITQAKLDEQRGVVQNEKRQYENEPYGMVDELIAKAVFPAGHPYSWTVIGSMEDLTAASLEDVHEWFKTYYGAANTVVAIAGDVDPEIVREKMEKYFGDVPPGPPIARFDAWIAKRSGVQRHIMQDRVPQARFYKIWNVPQWGTVEHTYLDLLSDVLASGKVSRLYKRLVYEEQLATSVRSYIDAREIAGLFNIVVTAKPGVELSKIEAIIDEEMAKILATGPTPQEVNRVRTQYEAQFVRGIERIGGFGGKSDILAQNMVFAGDPDYYKVALDRVRRAAPQDLHKVAKDWLSDGVYILEVHPFPQLAAQPSDLDRTALPDAGKPPLAQFPVVERKKLDNGLEIVLSQRTSVPIVTLKLMVDAGYAADQFAIPGTARLAMDMLDEGTRTRTALQISEELANLGAQMFSASNLDVSFVSINTLKDKLDPSLALFADVILNPSFPESDFQRLQKMQLAGIQREKVTPIQMALRVFPGLLYGKEHAYGNPLTGSGTEASVAQITQQDLIKFHQTWFLPNNAKLIVVGDVTMEELVPKISKLFKDWKSGTVPKKNIGLVEQKPASVVYLIDRPGSMQSILFAGHVMPPKANPDEISLTTMNNALGGMFISRINMNLREDKHWTYGAMSFIWDARGQRPFIVYSSVQMDKTAEAMLEIKKELSDICGPRPLTAEELQKSQDNQILGMAGTWETMGAVNNAVSEIETYGLPQDYYRTLAEKIRNVSVEDATRVAGNLLKPDQVVWVVVGDRSKIESGIREGNFGEIRFMDADGNEVK
ncbi:insulinase family protein [candidate division KSB1 bacterium]|nr:insulinase family protein [candidate division KSB1 bacterium]